MPLRLLSQKGGKSEDLLKGIHMHYNKYRLHTEVQVFMPFTLPRAAGGVRSVETKLSRGVQPTCTMARYDVIGTPWQLV